MGLIQVVFSDNVYGLKYCWSFHIYMNIVWYFLYFHNVFVLLKKEIPPARALWILPLFSAVTSIWSAADMVQE
jgi:hypothetical protein